MKGPRPSILEVLLGRTVEVQLPGESGRRKVSAKWFDTMVADGTIGPVSNENSATGLAERTRIMVRATRIGPIGLFVPLSERFSALAGSKPEEWDFFLAVGAVCAALIEHNFRDSSSETNELVRRTAAEELVEWRTVALEALEDCEGFVVRSMEALLQVGDSTAREALSKAIGMWIAWNVLKREPSEEADVALAAAAGTAALKIVEGCWD